MTSLHGSTAVAELKRAMDSLPGLASRSSHCSTAVAKGGTP